MPLRNRTKLLLAEAVESFFEYMGNTQPFSMTYRTDWFWEFLYWHEYPPQVLEKAGRLVAGRRVIRYFVLELSEDLQLKMIEDVVEHSTSDRRQIDTHNGWRLRSLEAQLELDGYRISNGKLQKHEAAAVDKKEIEGVLQALFKDLELERIDDLSKSLSTADEHYVAQRWGDSIKHVRDSMETVAEAILRKLKPSAEHKTRSFGDKADVFVKSGLIDKQLKNVLCANYSLLSEWGGHVNYSEHDHAFVCRFYALTSVHNLLLSYQGWQASRAAQPKAAPDA